MWAYFFRRLGGGLLTLYCIVTVSFFLTRAAPGSPFKTERTTNPAIIKVLEEKWGLDRHPIEQYFIALKRYCRGEFGPMWRSAGRNVEELVWPSFRVSLQLGLLAMVLALLIGIPMGVIAASGKNKLPDHAVMSASVVGICVPNFLMGPILVLFLSFGLDLLPPTGWPQSLRFSELIKLVMPAFTLALVHIAYLSRLTRAGMLDVLNQDYIRTARAKGVDRWGVLLKHALKNGITPALSYSGPMAAFVITGSLVIEKVFVIPGLGTHFVNSVLSGEYNLLLGCTIVYGILIIGFNALVDLMYGVLDPRVRVQ